MSKDLPFVSIVIPLYNSSSFIRRCLDSVLETRYPHLEIILVDDLSTDDTVSIVKNEYLKHKNIKLVENRKKLLAAGSRNVGFHHAKGEFVALLDHDVEVDKFWIQEMVKVAIKDNTVGVVQSQIYDYKQREILQCVGVKVFPQMGWVVSIGQGKKKVDELDKLTVVAAATGILYRKSAFLKAGKFDERLSINLDDLDLNWRMWIIGYKTVIAPNAITYHWSKKQHIRDAWISRYNWEFHYAKMPRVFIKNYDIFNTIKFLPIYLLIANIRGLFNIVFRFNFAPFLGLWASIVWNVLNISDTLKERKMIQKKRKFPDSLLLQRVFINKSFFIIFLNYWLPIVQIGKSLATERME